MDLRVGFLEDFSFTSAAREVKTEGAKESQRGHLKYSRIYVTTLRKVPVCVCMYVVYANGLTLGIRGLRK